MNEPTINHPVFAEKHGPNLYQVAYKYPGQPINWVVVRRSEHIYSTMAMVNRQNAEDMQSILSDGNWCGDDYDVTERGDQFVGVYDNKTFKAKDLDALLDQTDELSEHTVIEDVPEGLTEALWEGGYGLAHFRKWGKGYQIGLIPHHVPTDPCGYYLSPENMNYSWIGNLIKRFTSVDENSTCGKEFFSSEGSSVVGKALPILTAFLKFSDTVEQTPDDQENPSEEPWKPVRQDGWQVLNIPELEGLNHKEIEWFEDTEDYVLVAVDKNDPMVVRLDKKTNKVDYNWWVGGDLEERVKFVLYHGGAVTLGSNSKPIANALRQYASQYSPSHNIPTPEDIALDETEKKLVLAYRQVKNKLVLYNNLKEQAMQCMEEATEHGKFIDTLISDLLK